MLLLSDEQQQRYFGQRFSRSHIHDVGRLEAPDLNIRVRRDWVVEPAVSLVGRICNDVGLRAMFDVGFYDDSFAISQPAPSIDAELFWPDWNRAWGQANEHFPGHILEAAASIARQVILVTPFGHDLAREGYDEWIKTSGMPANIIPVDVGALLQAEAQRDPRLVDKYGTDISRNLVLLAARSVAFQGVASLVQRPLKALAVDFDNTLYEGILGEDGPSGLRCAESHRSLWQVLEDLRRRGVLLVACSKNTASDVLDLLDSGFLGPLGRESFVDFQVSWKSKAEAIEASADILGIGTDAFALIDDNPSERRLVETANLGVYLLDGSRTDQLIRAMLHGPNIPCRDDETGSLRESDLRAKASRVAARVHHSSAEDLHSFLQTEVRVRPALPSDLHRAYELIHKTNQFNTSLERTSLDLLSRAMESSDAVVAVAFVKDRYADSGMVAVLLAVMDASGVEVREYAISCRVLGRGLESPLFWSMLGSASVLRDALATLPLRVRYTEGPRNQPAVEWLVGEGEVAVEGDGAVGFRVVSPERWVDEYPFIFESEEEIGHG